MANFAIFQNVSFSIDMISAMPPEISTTIFRMLDSDSMLAAQHVCTSWYKIFKSDTVLTRAMRRRVQKAQERKRKYDKYLAQFRAKGSLQSKTKAKRLQKVKIDKRQKSPAKKIITIRM